MESSEFSRQLTNILTEVLPGYPDNECENCGFAQVDDGELYCGGCYRKGVLKQVNSLWDIAQKDLEEFIYCTSYCFPHLIKELIDALKKEGLEIAPILSKAN